MPTYSGALPPSVTIELDWAQSGDTLIIDVIDAAGEEFSYSIVDSYGTIYHTRNSGQIGPLIAPLYSWIAGPWFLNVENSGGYSYFSLLAQREGDDPDPPDPGPSPSSSSAGDGYYVYELDRGWTFDGMYIPHYIIFNWYFGENPTVYTTMQKIRVHGLAKGITNLQVQTNGIQTDYREDFTGAEQFTFKSPYEFVSEEFISATNYADLANRGLAIQLKFQGSNTNALLPEPAHVLQVLIPQSSPEGSGFTSN